MRRPARAGAPPPSSAHRLPPPRGTLTVIVFIAAGFCASSKCRWRALRRAAARDRVEAALDEAIAEVRAGATCVIDVRVAPEYARTVSSALLHKIGGYAN
jgi:hypothetical protein